jgi:hexokinase
VKKHKIVSSFCFSPPFVSFILPLGRGFLKTQTKGCEGESWFYAHWHPRI